MPAITRWSRRTAWSGRAPSGASSSRRSGGSGQASGPSFATASSSSTADVARSLTHAACRVPNSRRRSSRPSAQPHEQAGAAVARLGVDVIELQPPGGHQVHQQRQVAAHVDDEVLAAPPHARDRPAHEGVERRVERLQRVDARRERRLDLRAAERGAQPARHNLDFWQFRHGAECDTLGSAACRRGRFERAAGGNPAGSRLQGTNARVPTPPRDAVTKEGLDVYSRASPRAPLRLRAPHAPAGPRRRGAGGRRHLPGACLRRLEREPLLVGVRRHRARRHRRLVPRRSGPRDEGPQQPARGRAGSRPRAVRRDRRPAGACRRTGTVFTGLHADATAYDEKGSTGVDGWRAGIRVNGQGRRLVRVPAGVLVDRPADAAHRPPDLHLQRAARRDLRAQHRLSARSRAGGDDARQHHARRARRRPPGPVGEGRGPLGRRRPGCTGRRRSRHRRRPTTPACAC